MILTRIRLRYGLFWPGAYPVLLTTRRPSTAQVCNTVLVTMTALVVAFEIWLLWITTRG